MLYELTGKARKTTHRRDEVDPQFVGNPTWALPFCTCHAAKFQGLGIETTTTARPFQRAFISNHTNDRLHCTFLRSNSLRFNAQRLDSHFGIKLYPIASKL